MSTRERWIVYPLLFLTLGIVMRDKVFPQRHFSDVSAERIHCGQLQVEQVASAGGIAVRRLQCSDEMAAGKIRCGQLQVDGGVAAGGFAVRSDQPNGLPTVLIGTEARTHGGIIQTMSSAGAPLVLLQPTDSGGVVRASQVVQGKAAFPEKPKTPSDPMPKKPAKDSANAPAKTGK
jgi:hypothetical protein